MILTIDHGFNASTFTARVVTSTGADLGAGDRGRHRRAVRAAPRRGAEPGARHARRHRHPGPGRGLRPRRAVERRRADHGLRPPRLQDGRSPFAPAALGAEQLGGPLVEFSQSVERTTVEVLAELKPGRQLYTNVEFYAGVVMHTCGIPREMFTPTFAAGRTIGWCAHVMEQASHNRLIRPAARYVGPPPPQPVPRAA